MLAEFVDVIAAALPAALVWAAVYAVVTRLDAGRSRRHLLLGSVAGAVVALVLSVLRQNTAWINKELVSLGVLGVLLLAAGAFLGWLWTRQDGRTRAWTPGVTAVLGGALTLAALPDILLLSAGFVTPGSSPFSSETALAVAGYLLGLGVVLVTAWAGHRASSGAAAPAVRLGATIILGIGMLAHVGTVLQILIGRRMIPTPSWLFQGVVWLVNHEDWFGYALAIGVLVPIVSARRRHRAAAGAERNPAEGRIYRADALSRRRFLGLGAAGFAAAVVATTVGRSVANAKPSLSPPEPLELDAATVWVPLERIDDGHLHRFAYDCAEGTQVRFIAIRKNARAYGVGLDACNVCGPTGYYERDGQVICKLCDVAMNINTIGFKGGCNPIPLDYTMEDGRLVVTKAALEASAEVFA